MAKRGSSTVTDELPEDFDELEQMLDNPPPLNLAASQTTPSRRRVIKAENSAYADATGPAAPIGSSDPEWNTWFERCKKLNVACFILHASSFIVTLVLAVKYSSFSQTLVLESNSSTRQVRYDGNWSIAPLYLVPIYFSVSMMAHLALHFLRHRTWQRWLFTHQNPLRWIEYSFSASIMMLCIGILSGLVTYSGLVLLFTCQAMSIVMGWVMESMNPLHAQRVTWVPFIIGCFPAVATWAAIGIPFWASISHIPAFVIAIYVTVFAAFNVFPVVMVYQYKGKRSILKYMKGECGYMLASAFAKTLLGWQVVGGTLRV